MDTYNTETLLARDIDIIAYRLAFVGMPKNTQICPPPKKKIWKGTKNNFFLLGGVNLSIFCENFKFAAESKIKKYFSV